MYHHLVKVHCGYQKSTWEIRQVYGREIYCRLYAQKCYTLNTTLTPPSGIGNS